MPVDHAQILHTSLLVDHSFQHHDALNAGLLRQRWIRGFHLADQVRLLDVSAYAHSLRWLGRCRWWWRRRWRNGCRRPANDAANHSTDLTSRDTAGNTTHDTPHSRIRWRTLIDDHLNFLRNFDRGAEVAIVNDARDNFHWGRRCRWRGWWRRWRGRSHQESQLLHGT